MSEALRIERREYKYLVDEAVVDRVRHAIRPFCTLDPYAQKAHQNRYMIESLYLDTPCLALFRANQMELVERYKLRVRRYPDAPGSPFFLEVKARYHDTIVKSRGMVGPSWPAIVSDPLVSRKVMGYTPAVERFVAHTHIIGAQPTMLVRYTREAWASMVDDYARVTFDRAIEGQPVRFDNWSFDADERAFRGVDDPTGVRDESALTLIELKFTAQVPRWMMSLVETLGLERRAFSKYGRIIESHFIPEDERTPRNPWLRTGYEARLAQTQRVARRRLEGAA